MSKPDSIPQDVFLVASGIANDLPTHVAPTNREFAALVIARAIMAERERCAAVCQKAAGYYDLGAGSAHSEEARKVGKAQAEWCAAEIMHGEAA